MTEDQARDCRYILHLYRGWTTEDGHRVALAFPLADGRCEIICPYCGLTHRHGMPTADHSSRLRHCLYKGGQLGEVYILHVLDKPMEPWVRAAAQALRPLAVELARQHKPVWW